MRSSWRTWADKFDRLQTREKFLLVSALFAFVYLLWNLVALQPITKQASLLQDRMTAAEQNIAKLQAEETVLSRTLANDPDIAVMRELKQLKDRLELLDAQLLDLSGGLVSADKLPQVLHDVLRSTQKLVLQNLQTLPVEQLTLAQPDPAPKSSPVKPKKSANKSKATGTTTDENTVINTQEEDTVAGPESVSVFRHSVVITLVGGYFDVLDYLQTLESLPWRFYWDELDYQVDQYPRSSVTLKVYTLSAEEGIIGSRAAGGK